MVVRYRYVNVNSRLFVFEKYCGGVDVCMSLVRLISSVSKLMSRFRLVVLCGLMWLVSVMLLMISIVLMKKRVILSMMKVLEWGGVVCVGGVNDWVMCGFSGVWVFWMECF